MNNHWLAELFREPWAMEQAAQQAFIQRVTEAMQSARWAGRQLPRMTEERPINVEEDGTAVLDIRGALLKEVPWWFKYEDIAATSYQALEADLEAAMGMPEVLAIRLDIDSPGGQSFGLKRVADAIHAAGKVKPVTARVDDMAASAAYWLGSQASRISAGPLAMLGSIGTYLTVVNVDRLLKNHGIEVDVIRSAPLKGAGAGGTPLTADQRETYQELVNTLTRAFVADVARGRGMSVSKVQELATGETWIGPVALEKGLCDAIETHSEMSGRGASRRAETDPKMEDSMGDQKDNKGGDTAAPAPAAAPKAATIAELKAAFPGETEFVLAQAEKGATLGDAKLAFADVVLDRNKSLKAENEALKAKAAAPTAPRRDPAADTEGVQPLESADPSAAAAAPKEDFLTKARALADAKKIPLLQACSDLARREPQLHAAYREYCLTHAGELRAKAPQGWEEAAAK